ncbi:MAG TPA: hypothetical protein VM597_31000 [Gemmataceae bacterium]|jgi:hypothetical protein|nr:hypothetical protein [Gemmataceae bacterium]
MTTDSPVRRVETPTGLTFVFPRWPAGPARRMAGTVLAAGLILAVGGGAVALAADGAAAFWTYGLFFGLTAVAGAFTAGAAAVLLATRGGIHLEEGRLTGLWYFGPFAWPRFAPANLTGLVVDRAGLTAVAIGARTHLAFGYPPAWLMPVARELGRRLNVPVTTEGGTP